MLAAGRMARAAHVGTCKVPLLESGARVGLVVGLAQAFLGDVGVDLGGGERGVAEQRLDAAQVGAVVEQVGGEGVAQLVGGDPEGDRTELEVAVEQLVDRAGADAAAAFADEQRAGADGGVAGVAVDGGERGSADRDDAFLAALAADAEGFGQGSRSATSRATSSAMRRPEE